MSDLKSPADYEAPVAVSADLSADVSLLNPVSAPDPSDVEAYAKYVAELRQKRKPYGAQIQKLALPQRSGYKRHWFNDVGGRVQEYLDCGWTPVMDAKGSPVMRTVGSGRDNSPMKAYAMEIPSVFWEEVQQTIFDQAKAKMDDIKSAPIRSPQGAAKSSDKDKFYSPREEVISVTQTVSRS